MQGPPGTPFDGPPGVSFTSPLGVGDQEQSQDSPSDEPFLPQHMQGPPGFAAPGLLPMGPNSPFGMPGGAPFPPFGAFPPGFGGHPFAPG